MKSVSNSKNFSPEIINSTVSSSELLISKSEDFPLLFFHKKCFYYSYKGLILTLLASILLSFAALIVKYLESYNKLSLAGWRFLGVSIPSVPIVIRDGFFRKDKKVFANIWPITESKEKRMALIFLFFRALVGCSGLLLFFQSLNFLDLGDASVISSSTPIFVSLVSCLFLEEKCAFFPILIAMITLIGVGLITRPPFLTGEDGFNHNILIGSLLSLGSSLMSTLTMITLRYLKDVHYGLIILVFGIWSTFQSFILSLLIFRIINIPNGIRDISLVVTMALFTFTGQYCLTLALKSELAINVSLIRNSGIIFSYILQVFFLGVFPDTFSILGATVVLISLFLTTFCKWISNLPENDSQRIKFAFLLK